MAMQIRIKPSLYILEESPDVYQIIFTGTRRIKRFEVDGLVKEMIKEILEPKSEQDLFSILTKKFGNSEVEQCLRSLESEGVVERYDESYLNQRYGKQISFLSELTNSWEEAVRLQEKLQRTKVALFGVGGIGTWMVNGLYQIGIGEIRITDPDTIDMSNLNRQLYFTSEDIGKPKVEVIKKKIPDAKIITSRKWVSEGEDLEEITNECDFLVNCTDIPSVADTTRIIDKYARKGSQPYLVSGGYNLHLGMVGPIIIPGKTACFDCFLDSQKKRDNLSSLIKIKDIEQTGNLGPIAGAIANLQVMEIFKFLTKKGTYNTNRFAEIDFLDFSLSWVDYTKREGCNCSS